MGLGYSVMGQLGLLSSLGLVRVSGQDVTALTDYLERRSWDFDIARPKRLNAAKQLAVSLRTSLPLVVGAEHLSGSVHAFANQLNETAKTLAIPWQLPELNHHLLEGLRYPRAAQRAAMIIFGSTLYHPRLRARVRVTRELVERSGLKAVVVPARGDDRLTQALDLLVLAGYTSLDLSVLHRVNPLAIPTVDELKRRLKHS
jgi:glucose/mannose-6-phosphate isomerase